MITYATTKTRSAGTGYQRRDTGRPEPAYWPRAVILTPASLPWARAATAPVARTGYFALDARIKAAPARRTALNGPGTGQAGRAHSQARSEIKP